MSCDSNDVLSRLTQLETALDNRLTAIEDRLTALEERVSAIESTLSEPINVEVDITAAIKKAAGL